MSMEFDIELLPLEKFVTLPVAQRDMYAREVLMPRLEQYTHRVMESGPFAIGRQEINQDLVVEQYGALRRLGYLPVEASPAQSMRPQRYRRD